jgi:hypothetical protein
MIRRAEIRKHLRIAQQLKVGTLVVVALLLLAAYPVYLFTRSVTSDPVFAGLDALDLPGWATQKYTDAASGSRWCIGQCRFRERTWASERKQDETNDAYDAALRKAGWRPRTSGVCPAVTEGKASCWERDEYMMDMWVRVPICDIPPPRPATSPQAGATSSPQAGATAAPDPNASAAATCYGSYVTVKVFNAIDYQPVQ